MIKFATASDSPKPKTKNVKTIALFYALILVVFVVAQLFSFEEFLGVVQGYGLFSDEALSRLFAALIVTSEIFALPFLLGMKLSKAMRVFSMICGWFVALFWAGVTKWIVFYGVGIENVGFLGDVVELVPGWWAVFASLGLGVLSAWASWGMWPLESHRRRKTLPIK